MSMVWVDSQSLTDIADAIRSKNGESGTYLPSEMAGKITDLPTTLSNVFYYIKTTSVGDTNAAVKVYTLQNNAVTADTNYVYSDKNTVFHKYLTIGNIKLGYGLNGNTDYTWYLACNSGTVTNMATGVEYTAGQVIANWRYQDWKTYKIMVND